MTEPRRFSIGLWLIPAFAVTIAGCSGVAQENRTVVVSGTGNGVAFQHGNDGVYLATEAGKPQKIYELQPGDLLASTPQYRPGRDDECVFCVARMHASLVQESGSPEDVNAILGEWDERPNGRLLLPIPIEYTCYLKQSDEAEPRPLLTASANHLGVVGANMAVRFSPDGESLLFVDMDDSGGMLLKQFGLETQSKSVLWDRPAYSLAFEYSPGGKYLACAALGLTSGGESITSIRPANQEVNQDADWQLINDSPPVGDSIDPLALARQTLPVFNTLDTRIAYLSVQSNMQVNGQSGASPYALYSRPMNGGADELLCESEHKLMDIHWHPSGSVLGWLAADAEGARNINLVAFENGTAAPVSALANVTDQSIDRFVGFSPSGNQFAFTTLAPVVPASPSGMLIRASVPRNNLFLADLERDENGQLGVVEESLMPALEDVRLTFVNWSQTHDKLSGWATYVDTHRSIGNVFVDQPETPGDPPFLYDAKSRMTEWLPTSPLEKAYVGYYCLLHRKDKDAAKWLVQTDNSQSAPEQLEMGPSELGPGESGQVEERPEAWPAVVLRKADRYLFESICHNRLGNEAEAEHTRQLWMTVRYDLLTKWLAHRTAAEAQVREDVTAASQVHIPAAQLTALIEMSAALRSAEVFVGLGDYSAGVEHLAELQAQATTREGRFMAEACAANLALITGEVASYEMALTDNVFPSFLMIELPNTPLPGTPGADPAGNGVVGALCERMLMGSAAAILEPIYSDLRNTPSTATLDVRSRLYELRGQLLPEQIELLKRYQSMIESVAADTTNAVL